MLASTHVPGANDPALIRFVVEQTLRGRPDCLKDDTLGSEVLGRASG